MFDRHEKKYIGLGLIGVIIGWFIGLAIWASVIGGLIYFIFWCLKHFGVI